MSNINLLSPKAENTGMFSKKMSLINNSFSIKVWSKKRRNSEDNKSPET